MNDDQAQRFAQRMIETWPNGPRRNIWHDIALKLHDRDAALAAYADLERTSSSISTAQFHTAYQSAKRKTEAYRPHTHCTLCDDTGFLEQPGEQLTLDADPDARPPTSHWSPCRCDRGREVESGWRRTNEVNAR